jgi:hypothetical protein
MNNQLKCHLIKFYVRLHSACIFLNIFASCESTAKEDRTINSPLFTWDQDGVNDVDHTIRCLNVGAVTAVNGDSCTP